MATPAECVAPRGYGNPEFAAARRRIQFQMEEQLTPHTLLTSLRAELTALLEGGSAHASFDDAVRDFPPDLRGVVPAGLPYSAWQILEHLRIAQRDMLDYSRNAEGDYKPKRWPDDYWPSAAAPANELDWDASVRAVHSDRQEFRRLLEKSDETAIGEPFAWGEGQSLLREALQIADHNAYHVGELIIVRRLLGCWKK